MTAEQIQILAILGLTVVAFVSGRWRHDIVALASLLVCVFFGLVPAPEAFSGFGHPAVITVACVLILSAGLQATGAVDAIARRAVPKTTGPTVTIAAITGVGALLSGFMNNVGAMALLMPVGLQIADRFDLPRGKVLMPLSFGTILGGMTTLIGTPPNLIVSGFRAEAGLGTFGMFDFTPVGLSIAAAGVLFVALLGWRIVPARDSGSDKGFKTGAYFTEARVKEGTTADGKTLSEIDGILEDLDAQVIGMVRNEFRITAPNARRKVKAEDILVIEAEPDALASTLSRLDLVLEEQVTSEREGVTEETEEEAGSAEKKKNDRKKDKDGDGKNRDRDSDEIVLQELAVMPTSPLNGRSASDIRLRTRYGLNLLAISRQGHQTMKRLRSTKLQPGDVLLMQGPPATISGFGSNFNCVPLAARSIRIPNEGQAVTAVIVLVAAIAGAAFGLLPAAISFAAGVLLYMLLRIIPLRRVYQAIDWPVIVLLGALIPVAVAMETTGAADLLAQSLLQHIAQGKPMLALVLILIVTMTLSDFMNNAATAAVMCPIAISSAGHLAVNADTFLMAVAVGASCAFLTPIGHQNNTLILGPGGFRFTDYWRLGLPMEILVVALGTPVLLMVWPL
ncbi:MAG: SLC13 family permease [Xanthomonadales bacterium]|nr:SLC13 family permease [Xanthomonadales bacterium]